MRSNKIYIPDGLDVNENEYDQVAEGVVVLNKYDLRPDHDLRSLSSESDLAESPAGQTIRSSYKSPIFDQNPLEPCPVNGCPLNPQTRVIWSIKVYFHPSICLKIEYGRHFLSFFKMRLVLISFLNVIEAVPSAFDFHFRQGCVIESHNVPQNFFLFNC